MRGDWVWKIDSVYKAGKLHEKNQGPFLVISRPGPVNYEIQQKENGRTSIIHVDKLYPYTPEDGEFLQSWLPVILPLQDGSCQCDIKDTNSMTTGCQTDMPRVSDDNVEDKKVFPDVDGDLSDNPGTAPDLDDTILETLVQSGSVGDKKIPSGTPFNKDTPRRMDIQKASQAGKGEIDNSVLSGEEDTVLDISGHSHSK